MADPMKTITYFILDRVRCRWVKVTTDIGTWAALPHVQLGVACTVAGAAVITGGIALSPLLWPTQGPEVLFAPPTTRQVQPPAPIYTPAGSRTPVCIKACGSPPVPTPEPGTWFLFAAGLGGLGGVRICFKKPKENRHD